MLWESTFNVWSIRNDDWPEGKGVNCQSTLQTL